VSSRQPRTSSAGARSAGRRSLTLRGFAGGRGLQGAEDSRDSPRARPESRAGGRRGSARSLQAERAAPASAASSASKRSEHRIVSPAPAYAPGYAPHLPPPSQKKLSSLSQPPASSWSAWLVFLPRPEGGLDRRRWRGRRRTMRPSLPRRRPRSSVAPCRRAAGAGQDACPPGRPALGGRALAAVKLVGTGRARAPRCTGGDPAAPDGGSEPVRQLRCPATPAQEIYGGSGAAGSPRAPARGLDAEAEKGLQRLLSGVSEGREQAERRRRLMTRATGPGARGGGRAPTTSEDVPRGRGGGGPARGCAGAPTAPSTRRSRPRARAG
jgi:hypothetical protein